MVQQIISADQYKTRKTFHKDGKNFLNVSEFYYDTIQGEGIYIGHPAAFLRLQNCTLKCDYCDSKEVWRFGSPYTFDELFAYIDKADLPRKFKQGHHLVLTGGSPLLQQDKIVTFLTLFVKYYSFLPFIEIENESVIMPTLEMVMFVSCWNNSPKLMSCGVDFVTFYKPDVIEMLSRFPNSWFKFVISKEEDWGEIEVGYLNTGLIKKEQIILMTEGATRKELEMNRGIVLEMAVENGVRYSSREHITIWDKKVGV